MANMFNVFWYEGPASGNQRITGLTAEQALDLQKQEDEMKKAEAAKQTAMKEEADYNMKAGPALNQEIAGYVKANPTARPVQNQMGAIKTDQTVALQQPTSQFSLGSDSFNQNLSDFASKLQSESSLSGIPASDQGSAMQMPQGSQPDTESAYNGMLKGIPVEIAQDLIFQYHNGLIKPREFLKEVAAVKKSLFDVKVEDEKANRTSQRKIKEQGMQSMGEIDKQYVTNEGQLNIQTAEDAAALQRTREDNATKIQIEGMKSADEKKKSMFGGLSGTYVNSDDVEGILVNGLSLYPNTLISKESVNKAKKAYETYLDLNRQIGNLKEMYKTYGTELIGNKAEVMKGAVRGVQLSLKELENLGVLNGPDLALMEEMVPNPTGIKGTARGAANFALGDKVLPLIDQLQNRVDLKVDANLQANGFKRDSKKPDVATQDKTGGSVLTIKSEEEYNQIPSGTTYIGPDGKKRVKK